MSLFAQLTEWTIRTFSPLGVWGLFILSFIESSFFPIPPDVLLIVLILATPEQWIWLASVCTIASVLGGMFGYWIGVMGERVILEKFFSHDKIARVHKLFERYGAWAVFIAAFTPIPYKVFTIAAGVFYISLKKFIIASLIGRGMRFFLFAFLIVRYGNAIIQLIEQYEIPLLIASVALLFLGFFFYRRKKRNTLTTSSSPSA